MNFFTVNEVAVALKISDGRIRQFISEGRLKAHKKGRDYFIYESDLEEFLQHGRKPNGRPRKGKK